MGFAPCSFHGWISQRPVDAVGPSLPVLICTAALVNPPIVRIASDRSAHPPPLVALSLPALALQNHRILRMWPSPPHGNRLAAKIATFCTQAQGRQMHDNIAAPPELYWDARKVLNSVLALAPNAATIARASGQAAPRQVLHSSKHATQTAINAIPGTVKTGGHRFE